MELAHTRAMVRAALDGRLDDADFETEPVFGLAIPTACPDVPSEILNPRDTWEDRDAYDSKADELAGRFRDNFEGYAGGVSEGVRDAGPRG